MEVFNGSSFFTHLIRKIRNKKRDGHMPIPSHVGLATGILFFDEGAGFALNDLAAGSRSLHVPSHGGPFGDEPLP
jgi:hypothetical protein